MGAISAEALGITLMHEHLFVDLRIGRRPPGLELGEATIKELYYQPVSYNNLWWIHYHPTSNQDNVVLQDEELAVREASLLPSCSMYVFELL